MLLALILFSCKRDAKKLDNKIESTKATVKRPVSPSILEKIILDHEATTPQELSLPFSVTKYIADGHEAFDTASGDINNDNIPDLLIATRIINEDSIKDNPIHNDRYLNFDSGALKRQLLLLIGEGKGLYHLACLNDNAIPCLTCCGMTDPYGCIRISDGQISIIQYCASNCKSVSDYRFKFSPTQKTWYLNTVVSESWCFEYEEFARDTMTKKNLGTIPLSGFDINKDDGD
jgi:hypothetical protein